MKTFLTQIPAASTAGLDLSHYRLVAGCLDASGVQEQVGVMQDLRIKCVSAEARQGLLVALKLLVNGAEENGGTLTYMALTSLNDDVRTTMFRWWKTWEDMERCMRRNDVNGFWISSREYVKAMEQRLYVPYGKEWLHRGSGYAGEKGGKSRL